MQAEVSDVKEVIDSELFSSESKRVSKFFVIERIRTLVNGCTLLNKAIEYNVNTTDGLSNLQKGAEVIFREAIFKMKRWYSVSKDGWITAKPRKHSPAEKILLSFLTITPQSRTDVIAQFVLTVDEKTAIEYHVRSRSTPSSKSKIFPTLEKQIFDGRRRRYFDIENRLERIKKVISCDKDKDLIWLNSPIVKKSNPFKTKKSKSNISKSICFIKKINRWQARLICPSKLIWVGRFETRQKADLACDQKIQDISQVKSDAGYNYIAISTT